MSRAPVDSGDPRHGRNLVDAVFILRLLVEANSRGAFGPGYCTNLVYNTLIDTEIDYTDGVYRDKFGVNGIQ